MSLGESKGGLPPNSCTEDEAACLADVKRCIEEFHDNSRYTSPPHLLANLCLGQLTAMSCMPDHCIVVSMYANL